MPESLNLKEDRKLEWTVHLAMEQPGKAAVVLAVAILAGVGTALAFSNPLLFLLGFLVIVGSTADFLLPVVQRIDEGGASRKVALSVSKIGWSDVKRVVVGEEGVKLSPLERSTRLAPFRGVYLRFGGRKEEVLQAIEYWRERHATGLGE